MEALELGLERRSGAKHRVDDGLEDRLGLQPARRTRTCEAAAADRTNLRVRSRAAHHECCTRRRAACDCISLRAVSSARTSWALTDFACTGRYQPSLNSWAMPRASRRSVFTVIADRAAFTCRVSRSTASKPAATRPAWIHCDKGPASSAIRLIERLRVCRSSEPAPQVRSAPSSHEQCHPAHRRCTRSSVPARRPIRHNAPRLSSIRLAGPLAPQHLKPRTPS